ncbi:TPA: hypothetical protein N0F65_002057 [Lagenidium giganteum]|uniref:Uncharacterized protein n=1 Tax=Lagenidium giganteum TaxID=4803 RepID=A0AAV2ZKC2_9STRA|nr:TPA: hypothetical protein N0F65_002057 [Lagenidium giganteum]
MKAQVLRAASAVLHEKHDAGVHMLRCVIIDDNRQAKVKVSSQASVQELVELARQRMQRKYPSEATSTKIVGLRNQRTQRGASPNGLAFGYNN